MLTRSAVTIKCNEMLVWWLAAGDWWRGRCLSLLCTRHHETAQVSLLTLHTPHLIVVTITTLPGQDTSTLPVLCQNLNYIYSMNLNRNPHNKSRLFSLAASLFHTFCGSKNCFITEGRSLYHLRKVC